jgi:hypothetical protein
MWAAFLLRDAGIRFAGKCSDIAGEQVHAGVFAEPAGSPTERISYREDIKS